MLRMRGVPRRATSTAGPSAVRWGSSACASAGSRHAPANHPEAQELRAYRSGQRPLIVVDEVGSHTTPRHRLRLDLELASKMPVPTVAGERSNDLGVPEYEAPTTAGRKGQYSGQKHFPGSGELCQSHVKQSKSAILRGTTRDYSKPASTWGPRDDRGPGLPNQLERPRIFPRYRFRTRAGTNSGPEPVPILYRELPNPPVPNWYSFLYLPPTAPIELREAAGRR